MRILSKASLGWAGLDESCAARLDPEIEPQVDAELWRSEELRLSESRVSMSLLLSLDEVVVREGGLYAGGGREYGGTSLTLYGGGPGGVDIGVGGDPSIRSAACDMLESTSQSRRRRGVYMLLTLETPVINM